VPRIEPCVVFHWSGRFRPQRRTTHGLHGSPQRSKLHRSDYRLALESGKGVTEYQPFEPAANEIRSIWTWLRDELAIAKTDPDSRTAVA
jgi:hypothetical protein